MKNVLEKKAAPEASDELDGLKRMLEDFLLVAVPLSKVTDDAEHMIAVAHKAIEDDTSLRLLANVLKREVGK